MATEFFPPRGTLVGETRLLRTFLLPLLHSPCFTHLALDDRDRPCDLPLGGCGTIVTISCICGSYLAQGYVWLFIVLSTIAYITFTQVYYLRLPPLPRFALGQSPLL